MLGSLARFAVYVFLIVGLFTPAQAAKRVALVIGNSAYTHATPLRNPKHDAEAIAAVLEKLGFEVVKGVDLTYAGMRERLRDFAYKLEGAEVSLLFYAGHGLQVHGHNYLAPVDARLKKELDLEFEAMKLSTILAQMERASQTNLVFLDACRDNPLARNLARTMGTRSASVGRGLARIESGVGTLIAFATQPGNVALDGEGRNSPFTAALVEHIETPGLDVALVMRRVRQGVIERTKGAQVPWNNSSLTGSFMFKDAPVEALKDNGRAVEMAMWLTASATDSEQGYKLYLERYPDGARAGDAKIKLAAIGERVKRAEAERKTLQAERARLAKERKEFAKRLEELEAQAKARAEKAMAEQRKEKDARAERDRLAKERDDYQAKLEKLEAAAEALAAQVEANAKERKVAALATDTPGDARDAEASTMDIGELTLVLQAELKRVGCDPGALDGQWGGKGRAALTRFNRYAKLALPIGEPTSEAINAVKAKKVRICPAVAKTRSKPRTTRVTKKPSTKTREKSPCVVLPGTRPTCRYQ